MTFRRAFSFAVIALISALVAGDAREAFARIPLETFVANPQVVRPKVSPNGRYIAVPVWNGDRSGVQVLDMESAAGPVVIGAPSGVNVNWVEWANDDRVLISLTAASIWSLGPIAFVFPISRIIAIDRGGTNQTVLFGDGPRFQSNLNLSGIVHPLPDDPRSVLMAAIRDGANNLYRVDVYTGDAELVVEGTKNTAAWLADVGGTPRVRWDWVRNEHRFEVYLRRSDGAGWDEIARYGERELPDLHIEGFTDDPRVAIVASRQTSDRYGLFEYDVAAKKVGKPIFEHPTVDVGQPVGGPIYDPYDTRLLGVYYVEDLWQRRYFDPQLAAVQAKLDVTFVDASVIRSQSWSRDRKRFVIFTEGPHDPGSYYYLDLAADKATLIGRHSPDIQGQELGEVLIIKYKARDGVKIPGYLTMPPGKGDKNLPLVVLPHGGPELRDYVQYDLLAQMLANRGYMVLQPNFRGSGGYGRAFAEAGYRQWGRRMQDDVTDGVNALIRDGSADPNRICIVGASYGGYAALAGGAFTPNLYKCVASVAGLGDLPVFLESRKARFGADSPQYQIWVKRIGDPIIDRGELAAVSPALHAENFVAPVLLVHGAADDNVPIDQSKRMNDALVKAGKSVKYVPIPNEGHEFVRRASTLKVLTEIETFLGANIGN